METLYDPITDQDLGVVDTIQAAAEMSRGYVPDEEDLAFFQQLRRHRLPRGVQIDLGRCPASNEGAAVGTYFGNNIIGFTAKAGIFWRMVAPRLLAGASNELVYLTSSNHARRGPEALVRYAGGFPAIFAVWDWAHPPHPKFGRFVRAIPYDRWGSHLIPITIDGEVHHGLQVANFTLFDGSRWTNTVLWYNGDTNTWDLIWRHPFDWDTDSECKYFFFGPCIEPKGASGYGTTNKIGYADAVLETDVVRTKLLATNSKLVRNNFGFEVTNLIANHTVLAQ